MTLKDSMNAHFFPWRSLKTRVTILTLAICLVGIWSLTFYASQMLREDLERLLGEQQFSTATFIAADINQEIDDRLRALQQRVLLATILMFLLIGALLWWMLKRQLAPMLTVAKTLATLSTGDLPIKPLPITRQDEIGELIGGVNRLLATLAQREDALKALPTQAKGRDTVQLYSDNIHQQVQAPDHMTDALRHALTLDQLQLLYQPLVDLQTGQISGLEALLRWHHPELGAVMPAQFIPLAEQSGLISGIDEWVLRRACQDIRIWLDKGIKVPPVAVNVSPMQFQDSDLIGQVKGALADYQIDPALIYIDLTEGALMGDVPRSEAMLSAIKDLGLKLSLDDFGTGYSSLSYLKRFAFDTVKIDQSLVRDITINPSSVVIVKVIVAMAHGLGLKVIAKGVETEAQCEIMRTSMCDEIQGYFFSQPISAQAIEELFSEGRQLPAHLLRLQKPQRTLLLIDDEPNIVASLKRLFRRDAYVILTANSGAEGLGVLSRHKVDVIISDQRMPGMTGVEFLRIAKVNYPDTIRIVLSGYTELQSVTDAINEGAIYRFFTKPWNDEQLREQIQKAFESKELLAENQQLNIQILSTNQELVAANRQLGDVLQKSHHQTARDKISLAILRDALQHLPLSAGVDYEGLMAAVHAAAERQLASADSHSKGRLVTLIEPGLSS